MKGLRLGAAGVLLTGLVLVPADAGVAVPPPSCYGTSSGVTSSAHVVETTIDGATATTITTDEPLGFTVDRIAPVALEGTDLGTFYYHLALGVDGLFRSVTVIDEREERGSVVIEPPEVHPGPPVHPTQLAVSAAGSSAEYVYRISRSGSLYRDRTDYQEGGPFLTGSTRLRGGFENFASLVWHKRITLDGRSTDVLFGTTRFGRLYEVQVPLATPSRSRVIALRTTGFAAYDALVASANSGSFPGASCVTGALDHGFLAVDRDAGTARWYLLRTVHQPRSSDVVAGAGVTGADWTLPVLG